MPAESVTFLAFSPDKRILASSDDFWEAATGKRLYQWKGGVRRLVFTPDGKHFITAQPINQTVTIWDTATGKLLRHLVSATSWSFALSPDGRTLATGWWSVIRLWDLKTGKELQPRPGVEGQTIFNEKIAFSSDGQTLETAGLSIRKWEVTTGRVVTEYLRPRELREAVLSPDGKVFASWSGEEIGLHDAVSGRVTRRWKVPSSRMPIAFSVDGKTLAAPPYLWDVGTGRQLRNLRLPEKAEWQALDSQVEAVTFAPDGNVLALLVTRDSSKVATEGVDPFTIYLWDTANGKLMHCVREDRDESHYGVHIGFSPDSKLLATAIQYETADNRRHTRLDFFEVATGQRAARYVGRERMVLSLAFSPDGKVLTEGNDDGTVRLFDVPTGREIRQLRGHQNGIYWLGFSVNGRHLASASKDTTALVWDTAGIVRSGQACATKLETKAVDALWRELCGGDASAAYRAIWTLAGVPEQTIPFVQERLRGLASPLDPERVAQLIHDLDDNRFTVRDRATQELAKLGTRAAPALRKVLKGRPSVELRRRIEELLAQIEKAAMSPERVVAMRAMAVLEYIGTTDAQKALEALAKGPSGAPETEEAQAAVRRVLKRRANGQ